VAETGTHVGRHRRQRELIFQGNALPSQVEDISSLHQHIEILVVENMEQPRNRRYPKEGSDLPHNSAHRVIRNQLTAAA
jgi:hypothetical protein